jgi:Flp pilus assembly protein TadG
MLGFLRSRRGNIALTAALVLPCACVIIGGGIDYVSVSNQKVLLQAIADKAALASAQELIFAQDVILRSDDNNRVTSVAESVVNGNFTGGHVTTAKVIEDGTAVEVSINAEPQTFFDTPFSSRSEPLSVRSVAEVAGSGNICLVGLHPKAEATISMGRKSHISAGSCVVYSNSHSATSLHMEESARLSAELICVAGGIKAPDDSFTRSKPVNDCPALEDPLKDRPAPVLPKTCDYKGFEVLEQMTLKPGVYCGGLKVAGGEAVLSPGVYFIKDGPLIVESGTLSGEGVGFFLTGKASKLRFEPKSSISLSAPAKGDMAGMLFFEDRATPVPDGHRISSNDARTLVGTLYFPNSRLTIDAQDPVADKSDFTIILAGEFDLAAGPEVVLNTDYSDSDVPVPSGVGNRAAPSQTRLLR